MDGPIEEPEQKQRDPKEEEDDNESIDLVCIDQWEKDNSCQETSDQEENHDQQHHNLVEGTDGGGEQRQECNLADWSFGGTMGSSTVDWRMAALTAKNQVLEEQLKNAQLQAQLDKACAICELLVEKLTSVQCFLSKQIDYMQAPIAANGVTGEIIDSCAGGEEQNTGEPIEECSCRAGKALENVQLKNVQLQAQIVDNGVKFAVLEEKNKTLESQLKIVELREKALEKKLEEKDKQLEEKDKKLAQFNLANLGKQLTTLSGNSTKIQLHLPHDDGNHWDLAASSPIFTSVGSAILPPATGMGGGNEAGEEVKWYHAFALKGFPVLDLDAIMKKDQRSNVNNAIKKTTVFYYEVRIVEPREPSLHYHAIGLSVGYNNDFGDHVGKHPNSYGFDEFGQAYYVCGKIHHTRPQVPIQFWREFLYPTVSVSKLTTKVEANFGNNPAVPFRYDIANCPGLQL